MECCAPAGEGRGLTELRPEAQDPGGGSSLPHCHPVWPSTQPSLQTVSQRQKFREKLQPSGGRFELDFLSQKSGFPRPPQFLDRKIRTLLPDLNRDELNEPFHNLMYWTKTLNSNSTQGPGQPSFYWGLLKK